MESTTQKAERLLADGNVMLHDESKVCTIFGDTGIYNVDIVISADDRTVLGGICTPISSDYEGHGRHFVLFNGDEKPCSHLIAAKKRVER